MSRPGPAAFKVQPNPVQAGGTVTIQGSPGQKLHVIANGNRWSILLDKHGVYRLKEPVGVGKKFVVSDFGPAGAHNIEIQVIESLK